jgi:hypothetical protein
LPSSYKGDKRTARQIIADEKLGKINQRFPSQWKDSTFDEIDAAAKRGGEDAITARKLLTDRRFNKDKRSLFIVDV